MENENNSSLPYCLSLLISELDSWEEINKKFKILNVSCRQGDSLFTCISRAISYHYEKGYSAYELRQGVVDIITKKIDAPNIRILIRNWAIAANAVAKEYFKDKNHRMRYAEPLTTIPIQNFDVNSWNVPESTVHELIAFMKNPHFYEGDTWSIHVLQKLLNVAIHRIECWEPIDKDEAEIVVYTPPEFLNNELKHMILLYQERKWSLIVKEKKENNTSSFEALLDKDQLPSFCNYEK